MLWKVITILAFLGVLLSVAGFVWGGLNQSDTVLYSSVAAFFVTGCLLGVVRKKEIRRHSTAETTGIITRAYEGCDYETGISSSCFYVRYIVNGKEYRRKAYTNISRRKDLEQYVRNIIKVHYNPDHPKTSWVEIPGVKTW